MPNQSDYTVGCDAHKHYSLFSILDGQGQVVRRTRVDHQRGAIQGFLSQFPPGTPVALETVGNWYWIVDEIEGARCTPLLAHALLAKKRMGYVHKTDKLDADGLATLLRMGTLPAVWIPPGDLRDEREFPRTRMAFSKVRTMLKNRIHSTLAKYALSLDTQSDIFTPKWRPQLLALLRQLPSETRRCVEQELELLDLLLAHIHRLEERILERVEITPTLQRIMSIPGPAEILSIVIDRELGSIDRFPSPKHLASYSGLVPRVQASGGKVHYGRMIKQANNYLKWAFIACPGRSGQGSGQRGGPTAAPLQLERQVCRPPLRAHPSTQRPCGRGGRHRSLPGRSHVLGSQEGRALPGAGRPAPGREEFTLSPKQGQARA
jgi:transposase